MKIYWSSKSLPYLHLLPKKERKVLLYRLRQRAAPRWLAGSGIATLGALSFIFLEIFDFDLGDRLIENFESIPVLIGYFFIKQHIVYNRAAILLDRRMRRSLGSIYTGGCRFRTERRAGGFPGAYASRSMSATGK